MIYERQDLRVVEKCDGIPVFSRGEDDDTLRADSNAKSRGGEKMGGEVEKYEFAQVSMVHFYNHRFWEDVLCREKLGVK